MKRANVKILLIIVSMVVFAVGCKKSFFTDVNENPNVVSKVPPGQLLSTVEAALAYTQGGDISRFSSLFMQQVTGANSQSQSYYIYNVNPGVFDNLWPDLYTSTMENDYTLIQISDAGNYNAYSGIARILMAYSLQLAVDLWGSVPYSQAFHGNLENQNLHPAFDNDKALYDTIASLINVGTAQLNNTDQGNLVPGAEDVIYGGNVSKWIKFGHAIKARLAIHQSKGDPAMATQALAEIALSFTSNSDNAQYIFGTAETAANPWYQFNRDRPGDETFSTSTLAKNMLSSNDPRYAVFFDPTNESKGKKGNHYGGLNDYYGSVNSPVEFITYDELQFMSAEATLRATGNFATAQSFYQAGIKANMSKLGVAPAAAATYLAANGTLPTTSVDAAIAKVASQEFIALFLNPEAWTLWRRTNSPTLTPTTASGTIPRRLLWPQSEYSYNAANAPATNTLVSPRIFWDKL
jgi:Starch-binding associating with outer membrane